MHKQFKSVSLMTLLMALPSGAMVAANTPSESVAVQQQQSTVAKGTVKDATANHSLVRQWLWKVLPTVQQ